LLGLGDVVDRFGEIPSESHARIVAVVSAYVEAAHRSNAERVTLIGTEPLRRARNSETLMQEIARATGLSVRVLSEREEALLTFIGVTGGQRPAAPLIVVDIGGGSTEVSHWTPGLPLRADSLPVGSARLTNAHVEHDPPSDEEITRLSSAATEATAVLGRDAVSPMAAGTRAIFVGGTATNVGRLGQLSRRQLADDRKTITALSSGAIATRYNVRPRRARQMAAGVAIVDALLERFALEIAEVSDASLRDGAIIAAARFGDEWPSHIEELAGANPGQ
jgi:exopolyphosphatase/guanosine-5'-triphosphate,3'-diphosphate pyrophosphatase